MENKQIVEAPDEIDTWNTDEIVCPWCGYVFGDSWDYDENDDLIQCPECEKTLEMQMEHHITYYTQKPDWLQQWRVWNARNISRRLCDIALHAAQNR